MLSVYVCLCALKCAWACVFMNMYMCACYDMHVEVTEQFLRVQVSPGTC